MKKFVFIIWNIIISLNYAQDIVYVQSICNELASREYAGRGYTSFPNSKDIGIHKAEKRIIQEIQKIGAYDLKKYITKSKHFKKRISFENLNFTNKINPSEVSISTNNILKSNISINDKPLLLGIDYLPDATCLPIDFSGELEYYDSLHYINQEKKIIIQLEKKLMRSASPIQEGFALIHIHQKSLSSKEKRIFCKIKVDAKVEKIFSDNIYAFIPGTQYPDSFIVFSAHYDHLGNIDTTYFPGANDNASGVAVLLDLLRYFKTHPHRYSVAFYFFTGEEIGLVGSQYYVEHPLFDLKRIKCLINLDLMGGGSEGIMVVNGKIFEEDFQKLETINKEKNFNIPIKSRGKAQNGDHHWFTERGIKSFFIYTLGDITAYHDTQDVPQNLKFNNYEKIFRLIVEWTNNF